MLRWALCFFHHRVDRRGLRVRRHRPEGSRQRENFVLHFTGAFPGRSGAWPDAQSLKPVIKFR
jgi:hypothetical protein